MVLNAKGGCGKSTLSTNIAVFFARDGHRVCLADYDPQRSSLDWLAMRPSDLPAVNGVAAFADGLRTVPRNTDVLVKEIGFGLATAALLATPVLNLFFRPITIAAAVHLSGDLESHSSTAATPSESRG